MCTPSVFSPAASELVGASVSFKCENLQHVGAFKARGGCNAIMQLTEQQAQSGVVCHSSGNHAAAVARAARSRGVTAHIVMPENSPAVKIAAVRALGVEPVFCEGTGPARQAAADEIIERTGATLVHPYDNPLVIAGQGTTALEILQQVKDVDTVVIPVGGGGLLSGCLLAIKGLRPDIKVIAVEPEFADDTYRSWKSGQIEAPTRYDSIGDGLRAGVGQLTFPIINSLVDDILVVSEDIIAEATRFLFHKCRLVSEPSGAVPMGAMMEFGDMFAGRQIAAIITGGNIDINAFALAP